MTHACDISAIKDDRSAMDSGMVGVRTDYHLTVPIVCGAVLACAAALRTSGDGLWLFGYRWPLFCRLYDTLGLKCALCGMSRSFNALAHGDTAAGIGFHRLGPAVFALFCLQIPYRLYALAAGSGRVSARLTHCHLVLVLLLCLAVLANWFVYLGGLLL